MTMTFEMPDGPLQIQLSPSEAKKLRDTLDGFIKAAEAGGFPVPIRD